MTPSPAPTPAPSRSRDALSQNSNYGCGVRELGQGLLPRLDVRDGQVVPAGRRGPGADAGRAGWQAGRVRRRRVRLPGRHHEPDVRSAADADEHARAVGAGAVAPRTRRRAQDLRLRLARGDVPPAARSVRGALLLRPRRGAAARLVPWREVHGGLRGGRGGRQVQRGVRGGGGRRHPAVVRQLLPRRLRPLQPAAVRDRRHADGQGGRPVRLHL